MHVHVTIPRSTHKHTELKVQSQQEESNNSANNRTACTSYQVSDNNQIIFNCFLAGKEAHNELNGSKDIVNTTYQ
jgi:hypothetical protein